MGVGCRMTLSPTQQRLLTLSQAPLFDDDFVALSFCPLLCRFGCGTHSFFLAPRDGPLIEAMMTPPTSSYICSLLFSDTIYLFVNSDDIEVSAVKGSTNKDK